MDKYKYQSHDAMYEYTNVEQDRNINNSFSSTHNKSIVSLPRFSTLLLANTVNSASKILTGFCPCLSSVFICDHTFMRSRPGSETISFHWLLLTVS